MSARIDAVAGGIQGTEDRVAWLWKHREDVNRYGLLSPAHVVKLFEMLNVDAPALIAVVRAALAALKYGPILVVGRDGWECSHCEANMQHADWTSPESHAPDCPGVALAAALAPFREEATE